MHTISNEASAGRRRRRTHSAEFKAQVVAACSSPGVSIAAVSMAHGVTVHGRAPVAEPFGLGNAVTALFACGNVFVIVNTFTIADWRTPFARLKGGDSRAESLRHED